MDIELKSGFRRGAELYSLVDGKLVSVQSASDCTYVGDSDDSKIVTVNGFVGVIAYWRIEGAGTRIWSLKGIGVDLSSPSPERGWFEHVVSYNAYEEKQVETFGDWALAQITGTFKTEAEFLQELTWHQIKNGCLVAPLSYAWGDQAARKFVVISPDGEVTTIEGCGEHTPRITENGEEITSPAQEREKAYLSYDRYAERIKDFLGGNPRKVKEARNLFPTDAVRMVAAELWPISFGGAKPSPAP